MVPLRSTKLIEDVTVNLLRKAVTTLPDDVLGALREAENEETSQVARTQLRTILEERWLRPTGSPCRCARTPECRSSSSAAMCLPNLEEGVFRRGISRATSEVPLRSNAVHPISRQNPGDNIGKHIPIIHYEYSDCDFTQLTVMPKGAGSENMSVLAMLTPSQGLKGIKR